MVSGVDQAIVEVVAERRRNPVGVSERGTALLCSIIGAFECATTDQGVWWNAERWLAAEAAWSERVRSRLDALASSLEERDGERWIKRGDVVAQDDSLSFFLAAMAWGFGPTGYGWRRTVDVLDGSGEDRVIAVVECMREVPPESPRDAFLGWSRGGEAKLVGVGTAFGSKLAYFAAYDRNAGRGPLIADRNTAWAIWAVAGISDSRGRADRYEEYVRWAEKAAATGGHHSDDVERALFVLGPGVIEAAKHKNPLVP